MEKSLRDSNKPLSAQETSNILHQFEQAYINHEQIARIKSNSNAIAQQNKQREIEAEEFFNDNEDARMV